MKQSIYPNTEALNSDFAARIIRLLQEGIAENGRASLVVSGGRTPKGLFNQLSNTSMEWDKVDITLADERWVSEDDDASNAKMVRKELLVNQAASARFISLKTAHDDANDAVAECTANLKDVSRPFDVLILGMGEDGHTASLFPCAEELEKGLDMNSGQDYVAMQPTTAPNQRMSLTLPALLNSRNVFLHLTGDSKKSVLDKALAGNDPHSMPIRAVIKGADVELIWTP